MIEETDYIVLGAGMYGLYATLYLLKKGLSVAVVEHDEGPFTRASYINQARVHYGYHYPRSYSTALKSAHYFQKFNRDFECAINAEFKKIYAISRKYSLTSADQFVKFCKNAGIPCNSLKSNSYFRGEMIDGVFETVEYAYDARNIRDFLVKGIEAYQGKVKFYFNTSIKNVETLSDKYELTLADEKRDEKRIVSPAVLNATYGSVNQVNEQFGFGHFKIKYEICEIILVNTSDNIANIGLTVMDGPFFSLMPFGKTGFHSLTSVTFTPHKTCFEPLPRFKCQDVNPICTPRNLENCNTCSARPNTAWVYMSQLAKKYLDHKIRFNYHSSLFSMKPILSSSELDDARPTLVRVLSTKPRFIAVLSGKINTVFDLEEVLDD